MRKKIMTYNAYDEMLDKFEGIQSDITLWPSREQIEGIMEAEPEKYIEFAVFLYEKGKRPVNDEERESKKQLFDFINRHLELVDEADVESLPEDEATEYED